MLPGQPECACGAGAPKRTPRGERPSRGRGSQCVRSPASSSVPRGSHAAFNLQGSGSSSPQSRRKCTRGSLTGWEERRSVDREVSGRSESREWGAVRTHGRGATSGKTDTCLRVWLRKLEEGQLGAGSRESDPSSRPQGPGSVPPGQQ